jgi:restriction system protein
MARYWVIAPYDSGNVELFDIAWDFDLQHSTIALGWSKLGDVSGLSREELEIAYRKTYPEQKSKAVATKDVNALWAFYREIHEGDIVVARRGRKRILATGKVIGSPYYDLSKGRERLANKTDNFYSNFLPVAWDNKSVDFDRQVFSFYTIYEIPEERLKALLLGSQHTGVTQEEPDERDLAPSETEFALEKYLEDFIVSNFESIFKGKLVLYKDPDGNPAQQYPVLSKEGKIFGRIDILAVDSATNDLVVIELKKGKESDPVVGQTLRYMGWVKQNLCEETQSVKGLIVCRDVDERLAYAVQPVNDRIAVKKYKVDFHLLDF